MNILTWQEAEPYRRKGEKIYYEPYYGYYIVRHKKTFVG